ncbi:MAG: MEDS domain-containing protein [Desulfatitalea sp.]
MHIQTSNQARLALGFGGYTCNWGVHVRATAEMVWALPAIPGVEHLLAYESRLNYFIPGKPWISICLYKVTRFSGAMVMNVLRTHPYTISQGVIAQNPYFQNPDDWLRRNAPQFLPPGT